MFTKEPSDFSTWLEMATKGIAAAGKERIGREIGAHYAEAVEAHREKGESEEMAQAKALEELGSPDKAATKFKYEYLTERDEESLEYLFQTAREPWRRASIWTCFVFMGLFAAVDSALGKPEAWRITLYVAAWISTCFVLPVISFKRVRELSFEEGVGGQVRNEDLRWKILIVSACVFFLGHLGPHEDWVGILYWFVLLLNLTRRTGGLSRKLRKPQAAAGIPPSAA